ncbi:MAG: FAD-dependent oxidoreductase [Alcanivoracaceae bacterium]|nr:FAD-dependent oxidoreductase [Alcanivoracaceae bacterium]
MHDIRPVVIVGASLGGMTAARALAGRVAARVYEPAGALEWLPNIHELISGLRRPYNLRVERGPLLAKAGHDWYRQRVQRIDAHRHELFLDDGSVQPFSQVIVAVGGRHQTWGIPGADEHALPFKSVSDCQRIAQRLERLSSRPGPLRLVLVGAGVEGVEALGEILRAYGARPGLTIEVVDSATRVLPALPQSLDQAIRQHCQRWPVNFRLGERVAVVNEMGVSLASGEMLAADLVIWTGGVGPHALLRESHLNDPSGFAPVSAALHSDHAEGVYVIGDAVSSVAGMLLPKQAYHAMDMGRLAATNIMAARAGKELAEFRPSPKPQIITFGALDTFLISDHRVLAGPSLRVVKEAVYQAGMASFDRRSSTRRLWGLWRRILDSGIDATIDGLRHPDSLTGLARFRVLE